MTSASLGRWLRTVRPLRLRQWAGQVRHRLTGPIEPVAFPGEPPRLRRGIPRSGFLGAPAFAWSDGWRRFRLRNREVFFHGPVDWEFAGEGPLFAYDLHGFEYARHRGMDSAARSALLLDWIERHPRGVGWDGHPTSLRLVAWTKLLLTPGAVALGPADDTKLRRSIASQAETLSRHLETHLLANHYLSNLLALVVVGLAFEGGPAEGWLAHERRLRAEFAEQILPDGAHVERSPMYHALLFETVLDALNLAQGRAPAALEETLRDTASRMLGAQRVWTHPDGEIALLGDSAFGVAQPPARLEAYATALGVKPRGPDRPGVLDGAGVVRLENGPFVVIASVAGPMPAYQPGHAHADALSFELSAAGERVVTDTGVAEYVEGPLRDRSRATRAHATIEVDGHDQAELWASHRVGGRPSVRLGAVEPGRSLEASCAGWATPDTRHRRVWIFGDALEVRDTLEGRRRPVRLVLPLAPGLEPRLGDGIARLRLASGRWLRIDLPSGVAFRVERAPYFPEFGRVVERAMLVGEAASFDSGRFAFSLAERLGEGGGERRSVGAS